MELILNIRELDPIPTYYTDPHLYNIISIETTTCAVFIPRLSQVGELR